MKKSAHPHHTCQAIVVSCMDFRLSKHLNKWTVKTIKNGYDRLAIAGAVKNLPFVLDQIELSIKLHHTAEAYLINHEDCGAYGAEGSFARHKKDLKFAKKIIRQRFPSLKITPLYLKLDGEFVKI
jgi:carbonic anhydrase